MLKEPSTQDDPQYMFLRERLKALKDGWEELHQMWENRQQLLSQSLNLQMFNRDAKQAEVLLSQQEHILSKDETPVSVVTKRSLNFLLFTKLFLHKDISIPEFNF